MFVKCKSVFVLLHCALGVPYILELNDRKRTPEKIPKCVLKIWIFMFLKIKTENQLKGGKGQSVVGAPA